MLSALAQMSSIQFHFSQLRVNPVSREALGDVLLASIRWLRSASGTARGRARVFEEHPREIRPIDSKVEQVDRHEARLGSFRTSIANRWQVRHF